MGKESKEYTREDWVRTAAAVAIFAIILSTCVVVEKLNVTGWVNMVIAILAFLIICGIAYVVRRFYPDDA
ncbi:MAG: hypothetical protein GTN73_05230 [Candidatus Aminicenantes bacterium]|nr:hypothetical protein [Candidatus Aminicenantes bacterium]